MVLTIGHQEHLLNVRFNMLHIARYVYLIDVSVQLIVRQVESAKVFRL